MDIDKELWAFRERIIQEMDAELEQLARKLKTEAKEPAAAKTETLYENTYSLNAELSIFKGKKPTGVIFAGGKRVDVPTWKKAVEEILKDCNSDRGRHQKLMALRGKVQGRDRVLLGSENKTMRSPLKIADDLYVETHYDTETLLRIVTTRILSAVAYDYSEIRIAVRND